MMNDEVENGRIIGIGDFLLVLILKDTWPSRRLFLFVLVEDSAGIADQVSSSYY